MILCPDPKIGFIHIYKTGGTSLTLALADHTVEGLRSAAPKRQGGGWQKTWHFDGRQHSKFLDNVDALEELTDCSWRYITVVRNPYTWLSSVFLAFYHRDLGYSAGSNYEFGRYSRDRSIKDFFGFYREFSGLKRDYWGFSTQSSFVEGAPLDRLHIIHFEDYESQVCGTLNQLGISIGKIGHSLQRGEAKRRQVEEIISDPEFKSFVNENFSVDFEKFSYEMWS